jgi:hypothetical protein
MNAHAAAIERIGRSSPDLAHLLRQHVADNQELIPFVFMGELVQWATLRWAAKPSDVNDLLLLLETMYEEGPEEVRDLIGAGFVEDLLEPKLVARLGQHLSLEHERLNDR